MDLGPAVTTVLMIRRLGDINMLTLVNVKNVWSDFVFSLTK